MTPGEHQQREIDRQAGQHEQRMMERARFGSPLAADLFDIGTAGLPKKKGGTTFSNPEAQAEYDAASPARKAWMTRQQNMPPWADRNPAELERLLEKED